MLLSLLFACATDPAGEAPPEDLNYIPADASYCQPEDQAAYDAARDVIEEHILSSEFQVGEHFSLCDESSCAPCDESSSPLLAVVRDFESWGSAENVVALAAVEWLKGSGAGAGGALEAYINQALNYPYLYLLMSHPIGAEGDTTLVMSQGDRQSCDDGDVDCWDFEVTSASLDEACAQFIHEIPAVVSGGSVASQPGAAPFSFGVPLSEDPLPAPESFASFEELRAWTETVPYVVLDAYDPTISTTSDGETSCATIEARFEKTALLGLADDAEALDGHDPDGDGYIIGALSASLRAADVSTSR